MKTNWFTITNAGKQEPAEIRLYGEIGTGWDGESGVDANAFADALDAVPKSQPINLRIHSPGGSVFDGLAIYNLLSARRDQITAHVDGVALSAASFIAMAAGKIRMPKNARMMIHDAQGFAIGDSAAMQEMADLLDRESNNIAQIYADRTGKPRTEVRRMMAATTWMNGAEAKEHGFADELSDTAAVKNTFNLSHFRHVPGEMRNAAPEQGADKQTQTKRTVVMDKTEMLALLNKWGVEAPENATDEQIKALVEAGKPVNRIKDIPANRPKSDPAPDPAPPQNADLVAKLQALEARVKAEEDARLTQTITAKCEERGLDPKLWIDACKANPALVKTLENHPMIPQPLPRLPIVNLGNPLIEAYNKMKPGALRNEFRVDNWGDYRRQFNPRNDNTLDAALVTDFLSDALVVIATTKLAMLDIFSRDFGVDRMKPRANVQVRKATAGATAQTNPTNFESGDSTVDNIEVAVNYHTKSFHILSSEFQSGHRLAHLAQINAETFADTITGVLTALMLTGTYGTAITVGAAANFDTSGLSAVLAAAKNYRTKNLILDGGHLAYITPKTTEELNWMNTGAFGFARIAENNLWTGATANTVGFVCGPDAIAVASGLPLAQPASEFLSVGTASLKNGLTTENHSWYSRAGRVFWASYGVMFGGAAGDVTQAELLITS